VRTLSQRELNRALLARQHLLERAPLSLPEACDAVGAIQAQYAPSMYVGLWTRVAGFERDALTAALSERSVVQGTLMRVTIHLVSREDYWPLALATRAARRKRWLTAEREAPSPAAMAGAARTLRRALAGGATLRRPEIDALVGKLRARGVGLWLDLVRVPPSGTWERRRADLYGLAEDWIGPPECGERAGMEHLVRRYLAGFGPASRKDVAAFTGLSPAVVRGVLDRLELERYAGEDGEELLDLPGGPLPDPDTPAPVRLLPTWDATLLAHARRTGLLPAEHRTRIFHVHNPQSERTFLVDGAVAGTWREEGGRIAFEAFSRLDRGAERALREEADRLLADLYDA
jgi:winged helix DNA-binding protein